MSWLIHAIIASIFALGFTPVSAQEQSQQPPPGFVLDAPAKQATTSAADPALGYFSDVLKDAQKCEADGGDRMNCYVEASPQRCKQTAVNFIGNPDQYRRTWMLCVRSCGDASFLSRTVGECRR